MNEDLVYIGRSPIHGKGVFSRVDLSAGTLLTCDVIVLDQALLENKHLKQYSYPWQKDKWSLCIGFGNYFNHSSKPNVRILSIDKIQLTKTFQVIDDIISGSELTIRYNIVDML